MLVGILATPETEVLIRKLDPVMDLRTEWFDSNHVFIYSPFDMEPNQFLELDVAVDNYVRRDDTNVLIALMKEI